MRPEFPFILRFAALGALAFIFACIAHEAIGHGGACLLTGGKVELLTSVYFRCRPGSPAVDAAGPLMNFVFAAIALLTLRARDWSATAAAFIALVFGFNAMWGAGYMPYSALTNIGDWTFVFADHGVWSHWVWHLVVAVAGVFLYSRAMRIVSRHLPGGLPLIATYVAAVAVVLMSVVLYSGPLQPAVREALLEGALAPVGILYLALFRRTPAPSSSALLAETSVRWFWPCALGVIIIFLASMGPGYSVA